MIRHLRPLAPSSRRGLDRLFDLIAGSLMVGSEHVVVIVRRNDFGRASRADFLAANDDRNVHFFRRHRLQASFQ